MKNKSIIITLSVLIMAVISSLLYISYGFISAEIGGNNSAKTYRVLSDILKVEYSDGTEQLVSKQEGYFVPGSVITKTFTIKNIGNVPAYYSINLNNIVNDFERKEDLIYELYSSENLIKSGEFLSNDGVVAYNQSLEVNEEINYTLKVKYIESEENQIVDQGKTINANIDFIEQEKVISNIKILGNSYQEVINDDPLTTDIDESSPSPTNPSEIISVGNKENLFDPKKLLDLGFTYEETDDSYYGISGGSMVGKVLYEVPEGETPVPLKIIADIKHAYPESNTKKKGIAIQIFFENGKYAYIYGDGENGEWHTSSYIATSPVQSIKLSYVNGNINTYFKNILITKNTLLPDYIPFEKYIIPIVVSNPNLFDKSKSTHASIKNDTEGKFWGAIMNYTEVNQMFVPGKTYNITYTFKGVSIPSDATINDKTLGMRLNSGTSGFSHIPLGLTGIQIQPDEEVKFNYTLTIPDNFYEGKYRLVAYGNYYKYADGTGEAATTYLKDIKIVEGETNELARYNLILDEPLRGVTDYSDTIDLFEGTLSRNINKQVLNTSINSNILKYNDTYGIVTYENNGITYNNILNRVPSALNTHFKLDTATWAKISENTFQHPSSFYSTRSYMIAKIKNTESINITDTDSFRTWLDNEEALGRPVTLYHVLASSTEPVSLNLPTIAEIPPNANITVDTDIEATIEIEYDVK